MLATVVLVFCWSHVHALSTEDDVTAFIQGSVRALQHFVDHTNVSGVVTMAHGHIEAEEAGRGIKVDRSNPNYVDCEKYPGLCKPPFNCDQPITLMDLMTTSFHMADNGHANLRSWCMAGQYAGYMNECIANRDLRKAAQVQFEWAKLQHNGVDETDASYCFMEGHCTNKAVHVNTTVEEAELMCNRRLGNRGWTSFSLSQVMPIALKFSFGGADATNGFHDRELSKFYLRAACAMGNYHCDVFYCRETYCKKNYYIKKYSHLLPKTPGHLIKETYP